METYEERVEDLPQGLQRHLNNCVKKPIPVRAVQMGEDFRVNSMEGDYKQGKAGDYLMVGIEGEVYICDQQIWEKSYDWLYEGI